MAPGCLLLGTMAPPWCRIFKNVSDDGYEGEPEKLEQLLTEFEISTNSKFVRVWTQGLARKDVSQGMYLMAYTSHHVLSPSIKIASFYHD